MNDREHTCWEPDKSGDGTEPCISDGQICVRCNRDMCTWIFDDEGFCEECYRCSREESK